MTEVVKQVEAASMVNQTDDHQIIDGGVEERENVGGRIEEENQKSSFKNFLWHGGSAYDAWFSCASNQVFTSY